MRQYGTEYPEEEPVNIAPTEVPMGSKSVLVGSVCDYLLPWRQQIISPELTTEFYRSDTRSSGMEDEVARRIEKIKNYALHFNNESEMSHHRNDPVQDELSRMQFLLMTHAKSIVADAAVLEGMMKYTKALSEVRQDIVEQGAHQISGKRNALHYDAPTSEVMNAAKAGFKNNEEGITSVGFEKAMEWTASWIRHFVRDHTGMRKESVCFKNREERCSVI